MKKIFLLFILFVVVEMQAQEQNNYMTNNEIQAFLDSMIVHKNQFIGKTMGEIYQLFEQARLPMRHFSFDETSCWIDSVGKSYLTSVILFTEKLEDMNEGKEYFDIRFELDIPKIEPKSIFRMLPSDTYNIWWNAFKQQTSEMPIKDILYYRIILPMHI